MGKRRYSGQNIGNKVDLKQLGSIRVFDDMERQ